MPLDLTSLSITSQIVQSTKTHHSHKINHPKHSKIWEAINRIFIGYLSISGNFFGGWRNQQSIFGNNNHPLFVASCLSLLPSAYATKTPSLGNLIHRTNEIAQNNIERDASDQLTILSPIPDLFAAQNVQFSQSIDLQNYYSLSSPNSNLDLTIQKNVNSSLPNWLSLNIEPFALLANLNLNESSSVLAGEGSYAFLNRNPGINTIDISNPQDPNLIHSTTVGLRNPISLFLRGGNLFQLNSTHLNVLDVNNPVNIQLISQLEFAHSLTYSPPVFAANDNHIFVFQQNGVKLNLTSIDISNPYSLVESPPFLLPITTIQNHPAQPTITISVYDQYAYLGIPQSYTFQVAIVNVITPTNPIILSSISRSCASQFNIFANKNYLFTSCNSGGYDLTIHDIHDPINPVLISQVYLGDIVRKCTFVNNYMYAVCARSIRILDITDILNPQVVYIYYVDTYSTFFFDSFMQNNNIFTLTNSGYILEVLSASKQTLSGTPSTADQGLLFLDAIIGDDQGNSVVDPFSIHVGAININPVLDQQVYIGNTTLFTLPANTFNFPGASFSYTAKLAGDVPLPSFVSFEEALRTFIFAPQSGDQNTYSIQVNGDDGYGGTSQTTFDLVVLNRSPTASQTLSDQFANSGKPFEYILPKGLFTDLDADTLSYSAKLLGGAPLPGWLNFDPVQVKIFGTPFGKGVYPVVVTATDGYGGSASKNFTITVPNSAPLVLNPPRPQFTGTGFPYSYTVNTDTFFDFDQDPITFSADSIPEFLSFNPNTRTFTGTPQNQDAGTYVITIHATEASNLSASTTWTLNVLNSISNNPPVMVKALPNLNAKGGIPFNYTIDPGTFVDPEGETLTYEAMLEGGGSLPEGLFFDSSSHTLSGQLPGPDTLRITIKAKDPFGAFAIDTFSLTISDSHEYPPTVLNALPDVIATVGVPFYYHIPSTTFVDQNDDPLTITLVHSGGKPLPKWLKWDSVTQSLSGTPTSWDAGTFHDNKIPLEVWASDGIGSAKSTLNVIVQGESFWDTFIKAAVPIVSVASSLLGLYRSQALISNYFNKKKYQQPPETAFVGKEYNRPLRLKYGKVRGINVLYQGKRIANLPTGLEHSENKIQGIPTESTLGDYTIQVVGLNGFIDEEFILSILKHSED